MCMGPKSLISSSRHSSALRLRIPCQVSMVTEFSESNKFQRKTSIQVNKQVLPRPHQMSNRKECTKEDTDTADNHVGNSHERVFTPNHTPGGYKD